MRQAHPDRPPAPLSLVANRERSGPERRAKGEDGRAVLAALPLAQLLFGLSRGIPPDELCQSAGLQLRDLSDRDKFVPYGWYHALWQALLRHCPNTPVGIEFGKFVSLDQLGYLGQVFRQSRSGLEALRKVVRFATLFDSHASRYPIGLQIDEHTVTVRVARELTDVAPECVEGVCFGMVTQLSAFSGIRVVEARFHMSREPLRAEYERFFRCPVYFECAEDALVFERASLELPIAGASAERSERIDAYVSRAYARADDARAALAATVQSTVLAQLRRGELSEAGSAGELGMSLRSFQRRLREAGLSYSSIVAAKRHEMALRMLAEPGLAVYEVAFGLGYQDVSSFNRAFKRWTGKSPLAYRTSRT